MPKSRLEQALLDPGQLLAVGRSAPEMEEGRVMFDRPFLQNKRADLGVLRGAALSVATFLDLLNDFRTERFEVSGIARRDHALIDHDLGIFPFAARIHDVGLDRFVGRHLAALGDTGFDQKPRRVANRRHDFLRVEDI